MHIAYVYIRQIKEMIRKNNIIRRY